MEWLSNIEFQWVLSMLFVVGNALDVYTTYLCSTLPKEYRGEELNPLFKRDIEEKHWRIPIIFKVLLSAFPFVLSFKYGYSAVFPLKILVILIWLAVVNNISLYILRRIKKRFVQSPGSFLTDTLHIPKGVVYIIMVVAFFGISYGLASI